MAILNPYLNFNGTTEEAFNFYRSVFGGEFTVLQRFSQTPEADTIAKEYQNKIMHVSLPVGNGNVLMGTDAIAGMGHTLTMGNNVQLSLQAESRDEVDTFFAGLSQGGIVEMAPQEMFWGAYFAMWKDKFGVKWMANFAHTTS